MNWDYYRLYVGVLFSPRLPFKEKGKILKYLERRETFEKTFAKEELNKVKHLFYLTMRHRAYDLFTTLIYALALGNEISLSILLRAQVENLALTRHLLKHPDEIDETLFSDGIPFKKAIKSSKSTPLLGRFWSTLSKRTHTLSDGLKTCFANISLLHHPEMEWIPTLCLQPHHDRISKSEIPEVVTTICFFYASIISDLEKIYQLDVDNRITDYSLIQRNPKTGKAFHP